MLQTAVPIIHVSSFIAAEEFYCKRLGFTRLSSWPPNKTKEDPCYMVLARDGALLHLSSFPDGTVGAAVVYVFVDDVDSLYAELIANDVPVPVRPVNQTWGTREISVRDADRNVVLFGQSQATSD